MTWSKAWGTLGGGGTLRMTTSVCYEANKGPPNPPPAASPDEEEGAVAFLYGVPGTPFNVSLAGVLGWADDATPAESLRYDTTGT